MTGEIWEGKRAKAIYSNDLPHTGAGPSTRPGVSIRVYSVSYTHLDVYKRQVQARALPSGSGSSFAERAS